MKQDYSEIACVLDRSGSMSSILDDTIGGFNTFIEEQKKLPGTANVTLVLFDDKCEVPYNAIPLKDLPKLDSTTFVPRGMTALHDALGKTINTLGERLAKMSEDERPSTVILCIITDGHENSSKEFTAQKIKEMITKQQEVYSWRIVFLAANIDATDVGESIGIQGKSTYNFAANSRGVDKMFKDVSMSFASYRSGSVDYDLNSLQEDEGAKDSPNQVLGSQLFSQPAINQTLTSSKSVSRKIQTK